MFRTASESGLQECLSKYSSRMSQSLTHLKTRKVDLVLLALRNLGLSPVRKKKRESQLERRRWPMFAVLAPSLQLFGADSAWSSSLGPQIRLRSGGGFGCSTTDHSVFDLFASKDQLIVCKIYTPCKPSQVHLSSQAGPLGRCWLHRLHTATSSTPPRDGHVTAT